MKYVKIRMERTARLELQQSLSGAPTSPEDAHFDDQPSARDDQNETGKGNHDAVLHTGILAPVQHIHAEVLESVAETQIPSNRQGN